MTATSSAGRGSAEAGIGQAAIEATAVVLRVLGHPHRLRLLMLLMRRKMCVGRLAEELGIAQNAVSQHLGRMEARGIVRRRREGRYVYYEVCDDIARNLVRCMWRYLDD